MEERNCISADDLTVVQNCIIDVLGKLPSMVYKVLEKYKEGISTLTTQIRETAEISDTVLAVTLEEHFRNNLLQEYGVGVGCFDKDGAIHITITTDQGDVLKFLTLPRKLVLGWSICMLNEA